MAGCMVFVFAALGEFVVVKVLDVQYQYQINKIPKVLPMVSKFIIHIGICVYIERKLDAHGTLVWFNTQFELSVASLERWS